MITDGHPFPKVICCCHMRKCLVVGMRSRASGTDAGPSGQLSPCLPYIRRNAPDAHPYHQPLLITEASVSSNPENRLSPLVHFFHSPRSSHRFDAGPGYLKLQLQVSEPG